MVKAGLALSLLLLTGSATAGVFKYTDAQGRVHYTDRPPVDHAQPLNLPKSAPAAVDYEAQVRKQNATRVSEALDEEAAQAKAAAAERTQKAREQARRCDWAKDEMQQLSTASGVYELDAKGQRRYLDAAARAKNEKDLERAIARHCR